MRLSDPLDPVPGPSLGGDSVLNRLLMSPSWLLLSSSLLLLSPPSFPYFLPLLFLSSLLLLLSLHSLLRVFLWLLLSVFVLLSPPWLLLLPIVVSYFVSSVVCHFFCLLLLSSPPILRRLLPPTSMPLSPPLGFLASPPMFHRLSSLGLCRLSSLVFLLSLPWLLPLTLSFLLVLWLLLLLCPLLSPLCRLWFLLPALPSLSLVSPRFHSPPLTPQLVLALRLLGFCIRLVRESLFMIILVPLVLPAMYLFVTMIMMTLLTEAIKSPLPWKAEFSKAFHEVISLITGLFPHPKPSSTSPSDNLYPWLDVFGTSQRRKPCVFLTLFDKLSEVSKEIDEKFYKATDDKMASSALPHWSDVYRLGDLADFHKAPKTNESFSRPLHKPVSTSRYVSLSLEDSTKLEACIWGQIESQSFSFWDLVAIFEFLIKDANCVPDDEVFHQLVSSMTSSINSQAKASFSAAAFLKQKQRETLVSHLPGSMHASVKRALLSTPSSSSLFAEDVIKDSLT